MIMMIVNWQWMVWQKCLNFWHLKFDKTPIKLYGLLAHCLRGHLTTQISKCNLFDNHHPHDCALTIDGVTIIMIIIMIIINDNGWCDRPAGAHSRPHCDWSLAAKTKTMTLDTFIVIIYLRKNEKKKTDIGLFFCALTGRAFLWGLFKSNLRNP